MLLIRIALMRIMTGGCEEKLSCRNLVWIDIRLFITTFICFLYSKYLMTFLKITAAKILKIGL